MAIGTNEQPAIHTRIGIFDWLIGLPQDPPSYWERWSRDFVGMSWRGLFWTAPPGQSFVSLFGTWPIFKG
jgi:hypothetical protein